MAKRTVLKIRMHDIDWEKFERLCDLLEEALNKAESEKVMTKWRLDDGAGTRMRGEGSYV